MKVLLVGGNGLIGSGLRTVLEERGHEVVIADKRESHLGHPATENIYTFEDADQYLTKVDTVVFLAARVHDSAAAKMSPNLTFQTLQPMINTYYAAKANGVKRFIYLGGVLPYEPSNPLFMLHHMAQEFLEPKSNEAMETIVLKPTTVYAPGTMDVRKNLINDLLWSSMTGIPVEVTYREVDFVYGSDVVRAITGVVEQGAKDLERMHRYHHHNGRAVFYISSGQPAIDEARVAAAFNKVAQELGHPNATVNVRAQYGVHLGYEESDMAALTLLTGVEEDTTTLEQGIRKLITLERQTLDRLLAAKGIQHGHQHNVGNV